jgi:hypothetical protein
VTSTFLYAISVKFRAKERHVASFSRYLFHNQCCERQTLLKGVNNISPIVSSFFVKYGYNSVLIISDEYRRNWLLHLQRMPQNGIPLKSYLYSPHGKRTKETMERAILTLETERANWPNPGYL